jgi:hypothetical protein
VWGIHIHYSPDLKVRHCLTGLGYHEIPTLVERCDIWCPHWGALPWLWEAAPQPPHSKFLVPACVVCYRLNFFSGWRSEWSHPDAITVNHNLFSAKLFTPDMEYKLAGSWGINLELLSSWWGGPRNKRPIVWGTQNSFCSLMISELSSRQMTLTVAINPHSSMGFKYDENQHF